MSIRVCGVLTLVAGALGGVPWFGAPLWAQPIGTAFTYQGRLADAGSPANGPYDLQFVLLDAPSGGSQVGPVVTRDDVLVTSGLFTVSLDFGPVFGGSRRWLEVRVRPGASTGAYTSLTPLQRWRPPPMRSSARPRPGPESPASRPGSRTTSTTTAAATSRA